MDNTNAFAERSVIAGILRYGKEAYIDVSDIIQDSEDFTIDSNQVIYKCIQHIYTNNDNAIPDIPTIYAAAEDLGLKNFFNQRTEKEHLKAVASLPINLSNVRSLAAQVRKLHIIRILADQFDNSKMELADLKGTEPIGQILGIAEKPAFDLSPLLDNKDNIEAQRISDGMGDYLDYVESNPCDLIGISTGYSYFDMSIGGGLRRKTVNLIGARMKQGKTHLANNIGINISSGQFNPNLIPVLDLDTEMSKEEQWPRLLAYLSGIGITDIETGKYSKHHVMKEMVRDAYKKIGSFPYYHLNISGKPFEETLGLMRRWLYKHVGFDETGKLKDCVIIYDYVKLMNSDDLNKGLAEYQMLGFLMTGLHNFMVKYDATCLAFTQLNRDGIDKESSDVLAGSDRIGWLCSNFSIFKSKSDDEIATDGIENGNKKLVTLFARHGEGLADKDYINMSMNRKTCKITQGVLRSQIKTKAEEIVEEIKSQENNDGKKKIKEPPKQDDRF